MYPAVVFHGSSRCVALLCGWNIMEQVIRRSHANSHRLCNEDPAATKIAIKILLAATADAIKYYSPAPENKFPYPFLLLATAIK